jgi:phosphoglycolate phosphatase-like HAD superfamily hydrolase
MAPLYRYAKSREPAPVIWIDVDDTLLDFTGAHPTALRAVEQWARSHVGADRAEKFAAAFDRGFQVSFLGWLRTLSPVERAWQANVEQRLARVQSEGSAPRRWAREVWLELAAEECGAKLPGAVLAEAAQVYWDAMAEAQRLFEGVPETLAELHVRGYRVALLTSSDSRLVPHDGGWRYDPNVSRRLKQDRLHRVLHPLGPYVERLVIGDPHEKSGPEFYELALREVPLESGGMVIAVGDSPESDIRLARRTATAVRFGVLCDPHRRCPDGPPEGVDARVEHLYELLVHFF